MDAVNTMTHSAMFLSPEPETPPAGVGTYISGGRNVMADRYVHSEGYPRFLEQSNHRRFLMVRALLGAQRLRRWRWICLRCAAGFLHGET